MFFSRQKKIGSRVVLTLCALFFFVSKMQAFVLDDDSTNAAANMGERLFLETRFAEYFFTNAGGNANYQLPAGDPVVNNLVTIYGPQPGPFAGLSMNCRTCHLVNETQDTLGNRTYCDFARRSPVPNIGDNQTQTPRNAPTLVNALLPKPAPLLLHFDGQFATAQDLIIETLTGRNYGWNPTQYATAIHHIANIIRNDDGTGALAQSQYGGGYAYSTMFAYPPKQISTLYRLNYQYWLGDLSDTNVNDFYYVSDETIVQTVASLIQQYLETLTFSQDTNGNFNGSPYDTFLIKNGLPQQPATGETALQYSQRLLGLVEGLPNPNFVTDPADGQFLTQTQTFQFGELELEGLKIFLRTNNVVVTSSVPPVLAIVQSSQNMIVSWQPPNGTLLSSPAMNSSATWTPIAVGSPAIIPVTNSNVFFKVIVPQTGNAAGQIGNCVQCHAPPDFTDSLFHNNGAEQEEYDAIHGAGAFNSVYIPSLAERSANYNAYLPATTNHPVAAGIFITPPMQTNASQVDLGLWNVYENSDFPAPQANIQSILVGLFGDNVTSDQMLSHTVALFKTPTLRDLGQSQPYLHTGRMDTIEDVIQFYQNSSSQAQSGNIRNAAPELNNIQLNNSALTPLAAFLRSLNEDYTD